MRLTRAASRVTRARFAWVLAVAAAALVGLGMHTQRAYRCGYESPLAEHLVYLLAALLLVAASVAEAMGDAGGPAYGAVRDSVALGLSVGLASLLCEETPGSHLCAVGTMLFGAAALACGTAAQKAWAAGRLGEGRRICSAGQFRYEGANFYRGCFPEPQCWVELQEAPQECRQNCPQQICGKHFSVAEGAGQQRLCVEGGRWLLRGLPVADAEVPPEELPLWVPGMRPSP